MLLFPPFLGGTLFKPSVISRGIIPFIAFAFASTSTYILNDVLDRSNDANHPSKRNRPLPSGTVSVPSAFLLCAACLLCAIFLAMAISSPFLLLLLVYVLIQFCYTYRLKEIAIVDIFCISAGFLLRLQAGGMVFGIDISSWLFLSVFLLALFLSTGKRLGEMQFLGERAGEHRKSLTSYPPGFLEGVMYMTGGAVLVTYTMFVITRRSLIYTVPLCCFGLLRYIFRVKSGCGGDPTDALTKDGALFATGMLWTIMVWYGYYIPP
jgi:4-hydroxybenzoate polyprenyltransferase